MSSRSPQRETPPPAPDAGLPVPAEVEAGPEVGLQLDEPLAAQLPVFEQFF
jgi:hypothetical protein